MAHRNGLETEKLANDFMNGSMYQRNNMNTLELLYEIRDKYGLSTIDMARLLDVRDSSMNRWMTGKVYIPDSVVGDLVQIEEEILWLAAYMQKHPELKSFTHAHFKGAINSLGGEDAN